MRIKNWKYALTFLMVVVSGFTSSAQLTSGLLQQYLLESINSSDLRIDYPAEVQEFYTRMNYQTAWIQQENTESLSSLLRNLSSSANFGLSEKDYQYNFITSYKEGIHRPENKEDSLKAEILFTDAAIHFYSDIAFGNTIPQLRYTGIQYNPGCRDIPATLADYILKKRIDFLVADLTSPMKEIMLIEKKIKWFTEVMNKNDFKETSINSGNANAENKSLYQKLYQLGILDSVDENIFENILKQKIRKAQLLFNLPVNGELKQEVIRELNVPLNVRLKQLNLSINYYRWLSCLTQNQSVIVVNIPAAYLKVYSDNNVILEMRMVVGKPSTPTIPLASMVNEVIVYPYWHVPLSIATKELLPAVKRNLSYLDNNNYQVLDKEGKIVDPYSVNWHALNRNNFPYTIRQGTGCDNALGLLKLNFYNPFGAYLHDTPDKNLFKQNRRFFSHGCMRMEKPLELGHLVLKNNNIAIDTLTERGCLKSQRPVAVPADEKMPVIVWYNPVGVDSTGSIVFFKDVYRKFNWGK